MKFEEFILAHDGDDLASLALARGRYASDVQDFDLALTTLEVRRKLRDKVPEWYAVQDGDKVIGTGSGFQAAILYAMGAKVYTVERQISLFKHTKPLLNELAPSVITYYGDGFKGYPLRHGGSHRRTGGGQLGVFEGVREGAVQ